MKTAIKLENLIAVSVEAYMRSMLRRSQNELIKLVWMQANAAKLRYAVAKTNLLSLSGCGLALSGWRLT